MFIDLNYSLAEYKDRQITQNITQWTNTYMVELHQLL